MGPGLTQRWPVAFVLSVLAAMACSTALAQSAIHFEIPEQSADTALTTFARQADTPVLFPYDRVREFTANQLSGDYSIDEGLRILLEGTGMTALLGPTGQISIRIAAAPVEEPSADRDRGFFAGILSAMVARDPPGASVASQGVGGPTLEEIVVTARRYDESLQDAPLSINVVTAQNVADFGMQVMKDVIELTPATSYARFNKTQPEYSIRGVSSPAEGSSHDSSVQTVIDGVVISKDFMKNPVFFDVERIEVMRGPQGTSFGRNASTGLIHIVTKRPTRHYEGGLMIGAGEFDAFELEAVVSGPLSADWSGRLALHTDDNDGYMRSASSGRGLDGQSNTSLRGSLLFEPSESLSLYLKAEYNDDDDETPVRRSRDCTRPNLATQPPGAPLPHPTFGAPFTSFTPWTDPCDLFRTEISGSVDFYLQRQILNLTAEVTYAIDTDLTLTSITGYLDGESDYLIDAQSTPSSVLFQDTINDATAFSQEIRLDNQSSGDSLRWLVGLYLLTEEHFRDDVNRFYDPASQPAALDASHPLTLDTKISTNDTDSVGLFGEIGFDFSARLNGTLGARYSVDSKEYQVAHTASGFAGKAMAFVDDVNNECTWPPGPGVVATCPTIGFADPVKVSDDWDNVSFRASLDYALAQNVMIYGLYSEGYKTGGFQPEPANTAVARIPFQEETSQNVEIGLKGEWGGRFRLNATAFNLQYNDLQITQFVNFSTIIDNAANIETPGFELEYLWQVTKNFRLSGSYAGLHAEFRNTVLIDETGNAVDLSGTRPDNSPEWTGTLFAAWAFPLSAGGSLDLHFDWRGRSDVFDDQGEQATRNRGNMSIWGAGLSWATPSQNWMVSLWGRNLTNEAIPISISPSQPDTLQLQVSFDTPRSYGVIAQYRF